MIHTDTYIYIYISYTYTHIFTYELEKEKRQTAIHLSLYISCLVSFSHVSVCLGSTFGKVLGCHDNNNDDDTNDNTDNDKHMCDSCFTLSHHDKAQCSTRPSAATNNPPGHSGRVQSQGDLETGAPTTSKNRLTIWVKPLSNKAALLNPLARDWP